MSYVLYNAPQSTCSQKVRICLWEKGIDFEEVKLDLFRGDQLTPEYKKINPNGVDNKRLARADVSPGVNGIR